MFIPVSILLTHSFTKKVYSAVAHLSVSLGTNTILSFTAQTFCSRRASLLTAFDSPGIFCGLPVVSGTCFAPGSEPFGKL